MSFKIFEEVDELDGTLRYFHVSSEMSSLIGGHFGSFLGNGGEFVSMPFPEF